MEPKQWAVLWLVLVYALPFLSILVYCMVASEDRWWWLMDRFDEYRETVIVIMMTAFFSSFALGVLAAAHVIPIIIAGVPAVITITMSGPFLVVMTFGPPGDMF